MKVLLIYPPINAKVPAKSTLLGLGYLASVLRNAGHTVEIKDWVDKDEVNFFWKNSEPIDVIGISCMFTMYKTDMIQFLDGINKFLDDVFIVVGGSHASTFPEELSEFADAVVVGEGEEVICDIVENKRTGIIRTNRIKDLNKLPMPAWDLMMDDLNEINRRHKKSPFHMRQPIVHMITSRGCPNACTFCAVKVAWGRQWVARSAGSVVDEIDYLVSKGFREINFNDDNCSIDKERMYEICHQIRSRNIDIRIACPTGIHIRTLDYELLKEMKKAGFYRLCFGIETGNQEMQRIIKKNIDLDKARQVINDANRLGYWTSATFIVGFPTETPQQKEDTFEFAKTCGIDFPIFYNLQIQPKTEMYEQLQCAV